MLSSNDLPFDEPDIIRFETTRQGLRLGRRAGGWTCGTVEFDFAPITGPAWGTAAYAIRREAAKWLAALPRWLSRPTDNLMFYKGRPIADQLLTWQMRPAPCVQDKYHPVLIERLGFDSTTEDTVLRASSRFERQRRRATALGRKLLGKSFVEYSEVPG